MPRWPSTIEACQEFKFPGIGRFAESEVNVCPTENWDNALCEIKGWYRRNKEGRELKNVSRVIGAAATRSEDNMDGSVEIGKLFI